MKNINEQKVRNLIIVRNIFLVILIIETIIFGILVAYEKWQDEKFEEVYRNFDRELEVETYNNGFEIYQGEIRGVELKHLLDRIVLHNRNADDISKLIIVKEGKVNAKYKALKEGNDISLTKPDYIRNLIKSVESGRMYYINYGYDPDTGLITAMGFELYKRGDNVNEI